MEGIIKPHGGTLVNRVKDVAPKGAYKGADPAIVLSERQQCDLEMIAVGAMSPLTGFVGQDDYNRICEKMTLADGTVWPFPITCSVDADTAGKVKVGGKVALLDDDRRLLGLMTVTEKYPHDKKKQAELAYKTTDVAHPGVKVLMSEGDVCLAGPVDVVCARYDVEYPKYRLTPAQTRAKFTEKKWKTAVGFQTRNPIHRAHEYLTKCAQEICDGLLIHPLVGQTQAGDIPADVRMKCYEALIEKYYVADRTLLAVLPAAMRYGGPREAILHAILRQNYGCSHFIVGRDHAGVGNYYGTFDAQLIFDTLPPGGLAITPMNFEHTAWCKLCEGMVSAKTCPHGNEHKISLSGTKVRDMLAAGQRPPMEFSRPEIADILIASMKQ
ncbi:MAG: sulfate adenylyltransferase [Phycisphaerales bacterium]|nr:sulfate adenylyltransferase [Phycisphaerales bacterium]